jgi:hypothetical protein
MIMPDTSTPVKHFLGSPQNFLVSVPAHGCPLAILGVERKRGSAGVLGNGGCVTPKAGFREDEQ